ncbi:MAG: ABC transporter ATP-binding protein [Chloroflexi bacterium]|nr:ABC transporter ATP-binding protein [Chloroflexota bacterium]
MHSRGPVSLSPAGPRPGTPPSGRKAKDARATLARLWDFLKRQRRSLYASLLLVVVGIGLNLLGPYLMGKAIDKYILAGNLPGLARIALVMLAIYLAATLTTWAQAYLMAAVAQRTIHYMRQALFERIQGLPLRFFDRQPHGELMSRLTNDVENISLVLGDSLTQLVTAVLTLAGTAVVILVLHWQLALVALVIIPVMSLIVRLVSTHSLKGFRQQQEYLGQLNGLIEEDVTGARVVIAYTRTEAAVADFEQINRRLQAASTRAQALSLLMGPVPNLINNVGYAAIASAGGWMAVQGWVSVGTIATFINYVQQFTRPLNQLANLINAIQSALAGAERFFETIDELPEPADAPGAAALEQVAGDVVFDDVSFAYQPGTPVLKHVSLHASPGQTIALVGPTGAGKTTLINLLSRFYDVDAGAIRVDGHDIRQVRRADLRRRLGIVLQDTFLFSATVMENIRYGRLEAGDEEVVAAARLANADHFISRLPQGYHTPLSEGASNLSQGQRQLLAIARAILADPAILILDEATSSVDTRTEKQIQEALLRLMQGRTSFIIAHRLSTIRDADGILVIQDGQVVERGSHADLLAARGAYYRLYTSQFKSQAAPLRP